MSKRILFIALCAIVLAGLLTTPWSPVLASVGPPSTIVTVTNDNIAQPDFGFASAQSITDMVVANGDHGMTFTALAPPEMTSIGSVLATTEIVGNGAHRIMYPINGTGLVLTEEDGGFWVGRVAGPPAVIFFGGTDAGNIAASAVPKAKDAIPAFANIAIDRASTFSVIPLA